MEQPEYVLKNGTEVAVTSLEKMQYMSLSPSVLAARKEGAIGRIAGVVPGCGGDLYFVVHEDGNRAAYCFTELELVPTVKA